MADIYCDSRVVGPGSGAKEDPYKAIPAVAGNNRYFLARGSRFSGMVTCSSSNVSFLAYGSGPNPIIDADGATNALLHRYGNNLAVAGIDFTGAANVGLYLTSQAASTTVSTMNVVSCRFYGNGVSNTYPADGTKADGIILSSPLSGVTYMWCESFDNKGHGFDTLGIVDATWIECRAYRNGATVAGHGFSVRPFHSSATGGWSVVSGTIYRRALAAGEVAQKVMDVTGAAILTRNAGGYAALTTGQWDTVDISGTQYLYINVGTDPNAIVGATGKGREIRWRRQTHGPFRYVGCVAWENSTGGAVGEGHGFAADDMTDNVAYEHCVSRDNQGAGFQIQWGSNIRYGSCLAHGNALSNWRTTGYTENVTVDHACATKSAQHGMYFAPPHTGTLVRNSIAALNGVGTAGMYGIICGTTSGAGEGNLVFGNGVGGTVANMTAPVSTADPLFIDEDKPWLGLRPGSPCRGAGVYVQGARDRFDRPYGDRHIGPWADLRAA